VFLILFARMPPTLAGVWVLQFASRDRQAVDRKDQVDGIGFAEVARHLPNYRQPILRVEPQYLLVQPVCRLKEGEAKAAAEEFETVQQHMEGPFDIEFLAERIEDQTLQNRTEHGS